MTDEAAPVAPVPPLIVIPAAQISLADAVLPTGVPTYSLVLSNPIVQTGLLLEPATVRSLIEKLTDLEQAQRAATRKLVIAKELPT